ncbi:RNA-binding protein RO60-like [Saccostrea echinata]|uniref:RNA-binding protein RO60-like n=1 Tax=Saccostrea echinata TaxID=191078 RepID=UPI002A81F0E7|nr:RNA-binding protein RO60-like [Saccostrea echinata]
MASRDLDDMEVEFHGLQAEPTDFQNQGIQISPYQVLNPDGGYVYKTTLELQLCSFICTGSSSRNYRTRSREIRLEDIPFVSELIQDGLGERVVELLLHFQYRACRQDPLLFVLAICCRSSDRQTKRAGYNALPSICRIPTQLFKFLSFCQKINQKNSLSKGWGRAHRKAICDWYHSYGTSETKLKLLALHITKYSKRHGWRHKTVMRLAHLNVKEEEDPALKYLVILAVKGKQYADSTTFMENQRKREFYQTSTLKKISDLLSSIETAKHTKDVSQVKRLILEHRLVREHIPTCFLNEREVWLALARHMPVTALIRNLGKMSKLEIFKRSNSEEKPSFEEYLALEKLKNKELITKEKVHPFTYMLAINQYKKGENRSKSLQWPIYPQICSALKEGLYLSFENIKPTNKRFLVALDISKSVEESVTVVGSPSLQALDVAAFMLSLTIRTEQNCHAIIFSNNRATALPIRPDDDIEVVAEKIKDLRSSPREVSADASLPFKYAIEKKKIYDVFIIYTDSYATSGTPHPSQALQFYRQSSGKTDAKLVVCNLACSDVSIGDIDDPLTLTVCGFDSYVPQIISNFINGNFYSS